MDSDSHEDLLAIMKENSEKVVAKHPDNSFARLFWSQQLKVAQQKSSRSMRWHPVMVRWCIYLRHISGKGYNLLRDSGCISLPSQRTLRDYTYYNKACTGFSAGTDEELVRLLEGCEECDIAPRRDVHKRKHCVQQAYREDCGVHRPRRC